MTSSPLHATYSIYHEMMRLFWPAWRKSVDAVDLAATARSLGLDSKLGPIDLGNAIEALPRKPNVFTLHATAALSASHWAISAQDQIRIDPTPEMKKYAGQISAFLLEQQVELKTVRAARTLSDAYLSPLMLQGCKLKNFWVRANAGLGTGETTCAAGVAVERPARDLKRRLDPRLWQKLVPDFFESTFRASASPTDPDQEPSHLAANATKWSGFLFETASWPLPPTLKIRARNILNVKFNARAKTKQVTYSLRECLTGEIGNQIPGVGAETTLFRDYGGIDRDSGFVDVRPVPGKPTFTSFTGLKSIRFTKHLSFLNSFAPGYLLFWLTLQMIGGACYSEHPELYS